MKKFFRFSQLPIDVYWVIVQFQTVEEIYGKLALLERRMYQFSEQKVFFKYLWNLYFKNSGLEKLYDRIDDDIGRVFKSVYRSGLFHSGKKHTFMISYMKGLREWSRDLHLRSKKLHGIPYEIVYEDSNFQLSLRSMKCKKQYNCVVQFTGGVRNNLSLKFRGDEENGLFGFIYGTEWKVTQRFCTRYHVSGSLDGRMVENSSGNHLEADFDYGRLKKVEIVQKTKNGLRAVIRGFYNVDSERHGKFEYREGGHLRYRKYTTVVRVFFKYENGKLVKTTIETKEMESEKYSSLKEYKTKLLERMDSTLKIFEEAVKYKKR